VTIQELVKWWQKSRSKQVTPLYKFSKPIPTLEWANSSALIYRLIWQGWAWLSRLDSAFNSTRRRRHGNADSHSGAVLLAQTARLLYLLSPCQSTLCCSKFYILSVNSQCTSFNANSLRSFIKKSSHNIFSYSANNQTDRNDSENRPLPKAKSKDRQITNLFLGQEAVDQGTERPFHQPLFQRHRLLQQICQSDSMNR